jgi:hypothetical protein
MSDIFQIPARYLRSGTGIAPRPSGLAAERRSAIVISRTSRKLDQPAGGARRDRTDDLLLAKQALSQLSYGPLSLPFKEHWRLSYGQ